MEIHRLLEKKQPQKDTKGNRQLVYHKSQRRKKQGYEGRHHRSRLVRLGDGILTHSSHLPKRSLAMARLEDAPPAVTGLAAGANAAAEDMPASKRALLPRESLMVDCSSTQWECCPSSSGRLIFAASAQKALSLFLFSVTIAAPPKTHHQNENRRLAGGANAVRQEIEVDELPRIAYYYQKSQSFAESYPVF